MVDETYSEMRLNKAEQLLLAETFHCASTADVNKATLKLENLLFVNDIHPAEAYWELKLALALASKLYQNFEDVNEKKLIRKKQKGLPGAPNKVGILPSDILEQIQTLIDKGVVKTMPKAIEHLQRIGCLPSEAKVSTLKKQIEKLAAHRRQAMDDFKDFPL